MVRGDPEGAFSITWLATHMRVRLPAPEVVENIDRDKERVPHYFEGDALILAMPAWAWKSRHQLNAAQIDDEADKPIIEIEGGILTVNDWKGRFTRTETALVQFFVENWGKVLSKEKLHHELYAGDPSGGPDMKMIDVLVYKIRKGLEGSGITLSTHWGEGYALVRDRGQQTKPENPEARQARAEKAKPPSSDPSTVRAIVTGDYVTIPGQVTPIRIANATSMAIFNRLNKDFGQVVSRAELNGKFADVDRWMISLKNKLDGSKLNIETVGKAGWRLVAAS